MAYNQHYPQQQYGTSTDYYSGGLAGDSRYPSSSAAQNPFASSADFPSQPSYPPQGGAGGAGMYRHESGSAWSLDEEPLKEGGAAGAGYQAVQRGRDNPFAANYSGGGKKRNWKKWAIGGLLGAVVIGGVVGGIAAWKAHSGGSNSSSSSGSGKMQYIDGTAKVVKWNPSDPSQFETDSRLKPIFYGLAYTPYNALEPWCGATLNNVTQDIILMSQMTTRLRMYGSACNQTQLVLQAIQDTKVNMTVWLGAYVGDNTTVNAQQQEFVLDALKIYGADHVSGVTIGNEYVLNAAADQKTTAINYLVQQMSSFRTALAALNLPKTLPVGTADAGSAFTTTLAAGADFIMANVHPWFGGLAIDQAAGWTWEFFEENDVAISNQVSNKPTPYIAETGWPTASMTPENATLGGAVAGVSELQTFLNTYPCQANANSSYYFYFEPFDEPWKEQFGGVEPYWGLFDSNRKLKDITFPTCSIDSGHASG
ncbi:Glycoside hydrolase family 17 protein [Rhodotorula toruloides]|nr:Glycoside hydrolase family 17 protein [Rhodotorula toruloides]